MAAQRTSYLVITNPGTETSALSAATAVLEQDGDVRVETTQRPEELSDALAGRGHATVVAAGGDGTIHAVVTQLYERGELGSVVLGLIPLGTGNDFARGNDLPLDPAAAARVITAGHTRRMDLLVDDTGGVVVNSVHTGAGSEAALRADRWKKRLGRIGYPIGAALTALRLPSLHVDVRVDDRLVATADERVLQVAVGNGPRVGGGTPLVPEAGPASGRLDVLVSRSAGTLSRVAYLLDLVRGRHHRRDDVRAARGRSVTVSGPIGTGFWCSADGETYGPIDRRTWSLEPAAYTMLVPAD